MPQSRRASNGGLARGTQARRRLWLVTVSLLMGLVVVNVPFRAGVLYWYPPGSPAAPDGQQHHLKAFHQQANHGVTARGLGKPQAAAVHLQRPPAVLQPVSDGIVGPGVDWVPAAEPRPQANVEPSPHLGLAEALVESQLRLDAGPQHEPSVSAEISTGAPMQPQLDADDQPQPQLGNAVEPSIQRETEAEPPVQLEAAAEQPATDMGARLPQPLAQPHQGRAAEPVPQAAVQAVSPLVTSGQSPLEGLPVASGPVASQLVPVQLSVEHAPQSQLPRAPLRLPHAHSSIIIQPHPLQANAQPQGANGTVQSHAEAVKQLQAWVDALREGKSGTPYSAGSTSGLTRTCDCAGACAMQAISPQMAPGRASTLLSRMGIQLQAGYAPENETMSSGNDSTAGLTSAIHRALAALRHHMDQLASRAGSAGQGQNSIPKIIHQVYGLFADAAIPPHVLHSIDTFRSHNPDYTHILWGPKDLDTFVEHFMPALWPMYSRMRVPVLKADWVRYMLIYTFGGVYSDLDTICLRPVDAWSDGRSGVSMIVGIEVDAHDRQDWPQHWGRQLQFCQWTFAAAPGHPMLADVLFRSHQLLSRMPWAEVLEENVTSVTGPYVFTDAVYQYMAGQGYNWTSLLGKNNETQIGNLYVLSITGFSPGVGHMGAEASDSARAKVMHMFHGGWTTHREHGQAFIVHGPWGGNKDKKRRRIQLHAASTKERPIRLEDAGWDAGMVTKSGVP